MFVSFLLFVEQGGGKEEEREHEAGCCVAVSSETDILHTREKLHKT